MKKGARSVTRQEGCVDAILGEKENPKNSMWKFNENCWSCRLGIDNRQQPLYGQDWVIAATYLYRSTDRKKAGRSKALLAASCAPIFSEREKMKIQNVRFSSGQAGFFFDDQESIRTGVSMDGFSYKGMPVTPGYRKIREPSESISIILILEDGQTAVGDCCAVQYSGVGGRDPLFLAGAYARWLETNLGPLLIGRDCSRFRENAAFFDECKIEEDKPLHTAIRYGITQALLDASAKAAHCTIAKTVAKEYGLSFKPEPVKIFAQSGDDRYINADKMILKGVDVLPHGLINDPKKKVGAEGEIFEQYVIWLRNRILETRTDALYCPELHFDVYGALGIVFDQNISRIVDYMARLEKAAAPFSIRIEAPVDAGSQEKQVEVSKSMMEMISRKGLSVEIVADEWCNTLDDIKLFVDERACHMIQIKTPDLGGINNTIEAVGYCREKGVKAYQGGSCTETDIASRICTQIALATQPHQILAKPGMGVDEGFMIVRNEMNRAIALYS